MKSDGDGGFLGSVGISADEGNFKSREVLP